MIKVNLLKNKGVVKSSIGPGPSAVAEPINLDAGFQVNGAGGGLSEQLAGVIKILLMIGGVGLLFAYEKVLSQQARQQIERVRAEKDRLLELRYEKETKANKLTEIQGKFDFLNSRSIEFKDATKFRLGELETLDAIQSSITRQAWLNTVSYKAGKVNILGASYSGQGFDEFNANLERQRIFKSVRYTKVSDSQTNAGGAELTEFQLTAEVNEEYLGGR